MHEKQKRKVASNKCKIQAKEVKNERWKEERECSEGNQVKVGKKGKYKEKECMRSKRENNKREIRQKCWKKYKGNKKKNRKEGNQEMEKSETIKVKKKKN